MTARYRHDYAAFGQAVLCAPWMVANMAERADRVKAVAEATAPDRTPLGEGYKYRFRTESGVRDNKTPRAFGRVINDDPAARLVEYGSEHNPRHRTLGKALDAAGD